ncbi:MAG: sporulation protein YqfD, partial [Oscillospiraceae bacterium]|nr:sporulation protein YqfD [Candidatus Equicaccousia limihippi]
MPVLKLVRMFNGYLTAKSYGAHPEKIIDICYLYGINIWNVQRREEAILF